MKKKLFTLLTLLLCLCSGAWADDTYTYNFNGASPLNEWTSTPSTAVAIQATGSQLQSLADPGSAYLSYSVTDNDSKTITIRSTQSYSNIKKISLKEVCSDNSKPAITIRVVNGNGVTQATFLNAGGHRASFSNPGTNKWSNSTEFELANTATGYIEFYLNSSGTGKYGGFDDIVITYNHTDAPATPTLTGAFSPASAEVSKGDDAPTLPTYTVTASDASETAGKYTVTYSLKAGSTEGIFTYTAEDGISAISTATAGTATIVATLSNPADGYSIGTATAEYTVTVNNVLEAVTNQIWDFTSSSEFPGASTSAYTAETYVNNVMIGNGATLRIAEDSKPQRLMLNNKATTSGYYVKIKVAAHSRVTVSAVGGSGRNIYFAENAVGGTQLAKLSCTNSSAQDKVLGNSGDGEKVICIYNKDGNDNKYNITLYSIKVEPASVSGTITESGWNTFSSNAALDLSTISGGKAYVATTTSSNYVKVEEVKTGIVAAGTGLMINGTPGATFTINTTADDATFSGTNLLVGLPNGGTVTKNANNYVFAWPTDKHEEYGFYFVNDFEPTLPAGKAYLHTTAPIQGARLNIVFDGEATGISNLNVNNNDNNDVNAPMYNLAGQKVSKNYKGIVIVNGKKVVRK